MAEKFYITTAISYPNGPPHIGHAYEVIAADAIARFKRLDGYDVFFVTGTDEHGLKIQQTAAKSGTTPRAFVDAMAPSFRAMAERLSCSFDRFIRTTDPDHLPSTQELWRRMQARGDIYLSKYNGWYSVRDEAYYDESELTKTPDGAWQAPTGTPVEWVEEESYFFRLSAYQDRLLEHYAQHPTFIGPETRRNEIVSFVRGGLQDLSISRTTFDWGLPVPGDPKHVMYVWIDALNNYVTACGFPDETAERWRYWPADVHIIGKDITRFHTVYWPAFLLSAGLPLPKRVFGHGFLFNRGEKMSKSVGNVIDPFALADAYGVDQLRYFLLREVPFGQDGNYSHEAIVNRINADLANDLGNLAQRSLSMIARNCDGVVPEPGRADGRRSRDPVGRGRAAGQGEGGHAGLRPARHPGRDLGRRRRSEPLLRRRRALGAPQDRPGPHGDGALRHRGGAADRRHHDPADRAGGGREAPRPHRHRPGPARSRRHRGRAAPRLRNRA